MFSFTNWRFITTIGLCLLAFGLASTIYAQTGSGSSPKPAKPSTAPSPKPSAKPVTPTTAPKAKASPATKPSPSAAIKPAIVSLPANAPDGLYVLIDSVKGKIVASLDAQNSPLAVIAFIGLTEGSIKNSKGGPFYDGTKIHRSVDGLLVQAGSPDGSDSGGPGFAFYDETDPVLNFSETGRLAFANAGPGTNGSQFFITKSPAPWLDGRYSIFGQVFSGQEVVNKLLQGDTLNKLTIIRKGKAAEAFKADQAAFDSAANSLADRNQKKISDQLAKLLPNAQKTSDGRWFVIEKVGSGTAPLSGQTITMNYTGRFLSGRIFDASSADAPVSVKLGTGRIIPGWDQTLTEMKVGEKRIVAIPPNLAFGDKGVDNGAENSIPPNSWVIVDIELLSASK